jgi:hypothetical protein
VRAWLLFLALGALAALLAAGCTALVSFDTMTLPCDGGVCFDGQSHDAHSGETDARVIDASSSVDAMEAAPKDATGDVDPCLAKADGGTCGTGDSCNDPPVCLDGVCTPRPMKDGRQCAFAKDACHSIPVCTKGVCGPSMTLPDSTEWEAGNDNARCCGGAPVMTTTVDNCGVCDIKCNPGQSCTNVNGNHYFCTPCTTGADCWSGCCSDTLTSHCSPSDCTTGDCQAHVCPDGTSCITATPIDFCSY